MPEIENGETFTVSLAGAGIDIKREVSGKKFALVVSVLMGINPLEALAFQPPDISRPAGSPKVSLREFLDNARATTKPDQIVAIGHFMTSYEGKDAFSRNDIKARFQYARERPPSNFPRDFSTAISKGMIAEDHATAGHYYVTKTGAQAVERHFGAQN